VTETVPSNRVIGIALAILLVSLVGIALSLFIPLLSLEMERRGIPAWLNGLNTAVGGVGTLAVAPFITSLAQRIGAARIIAAAIIVSALCGLVFLQVPFWAWFPLRFVLGAGLGAMFVLSEFWIASEATPERRGLIMGIYATVLSAGFAAGPLVLATFTSTPMQAAFVGSAIMACALVPLLLAWKYVPKLQPEPRRNMFGMLTAAPVAPLAGLLFGGIETGAFGLLPVYGVRFGLPEASAAILISVMTAGNIALQIPLGLLSDKVDRVKLLIAIAALGAVGACLLPFAMDTPTYRFALLFVWGGVTGGLYTVGLALLASRFSGSALAEANAAFVMLYSLGMIIGPALLGLAMDLGGTHGFAVLFALALAAFTIFAKLRSA
jgi:MFS family permease